MSLPQYPSNARRARLAADKGGARANVPARAAGALAGLALVLLCAAPVLAQPARPPQPPRPQRGAEQPPSRTPVEAARAIAYLMRVADNACPGVVFDPKPLSLRIDKKGLTPLQVREKFRDEFQKSYEEAGARVATDGIGGYCDVVVNRFAKRPKDYPGLRIR